MANNKRILIVEDDADISMVEEAYLEAAGFETKIITEGTMAAAILEQEYFNLVLLDLMLPGKSGYDICREIRDSVDIPILMVTARSEPIDKIRGLGLGADDYIAKPFDPAELVARVHANLRQYERLKQKIPERKEKEPEEIKICDLRILINSWKVYKGNKEIKFPNREFEILKFFASATVMVHINRIREKIEDDSKKPKILETVWGAGYRLNQLPEDFTGTDSLCK